VSNFKNHGNCSSKFIFAEYGVESCEYEIIEEGDDDTRNERERFYIENNTCVNKVIPGRTGKEWREANREKKSEQQKEWYKANREKVLEHLRKYCKANKAKISERMKKYREKAKSQVSPL
jgi:hypothetical protein